MAAKSVIRTFCPLSKSENMTDQVTTTVAIVLTPLLATNVATAFALYQTKEQLEGEKKVPLTPKLTS